MRKAISNTSPLLYLYRIGGIDWLPKLFDEIGSPEAVKSELRVGRSKGYDVPELGDYLWLSILPPEALSSILNTPSSHQPHAFVAMLKEHGYGQGPGQPSAGRLFLEAGGAFALKSPLQAPDRSIFVIDILTSSNL